MTAICDTLDPLLSLYATGALEGEEAFRLSSHLEGCAACRAQMEQTRDLLDLVRLPPVSPAEGLVLADLPTRTLGALRRRDKGRGLRRRLLVGGAVAAALVLALLAPAFLRARAPRLDEVALEASHASETSTTAAAWEEPDPGTLWNESAVLDLSSSSSRSGSVTDAVLAAYDEGAGI